MESNPVHEFKTLDDWNNHFNSLKDSDKLMVVDLMATWSAPSKTMKPIFMEMAKEFTDVDFVIIDIDVLPEVFKIYFGRTTPTFVLLKQGKEVDRLVGGDKEKLKEKIEKHRPNITESDE